MRLMYPRFLQLPPEIRDRIHDYAFVDEHQDTIRSRIHATSLVSKREHRERGWPWHCSTSWMPTPSPLPRFHTPCILRVCKQVRCEALDVLSRTKTLVVTITSEEDKLCDLNQSWLPSISRFQRVRVDIILTCATAGTVLECFRRVTWLASTQQTPSLQLLEIRLGYSTANISAAIHDHGLSLVLDSKDIARSMRQLALLSRARNNQQNQEYRRLQIRWGVSTEHVKAGDFSCHCRYLSATFLMLIWTRVCDEMEGKEDNAGIELSEQDCRHFGCAYHSHDV